MFRETVTVGDREITIESGEIARQASGAVIVTSGDTVVFATVTAGTSPSRFSFLPLTVEYRWRYSAAGRIPGSYDRREARPSDTETLTCRLIDRSIRPFFPDGWRFDTLMMVQPLSYDPEVEPEVLGISAAAAALAVSDIPWPEPIAGIRIGQTDDGLKVFPSPSELATGGLDLIVTVGTGGIVMVEGGANEAPEELVFEAFELARASAAPLLTVLEKLRTAGSEERVFTRDASVETARGEIRPKVLSAGEAPMVDALAVDDKLARYRATDAVRESVLASFDAAPEEKPSELQRNLIVEEVDALKKSLIRKHILAGNRIGGRGAKDIRQITGRTGWLKRCHGSSLFTRGETQAIVTCTLGGERDAKMSDSLDGRKADKFLLHYNFPSYSVGEVKPVRGPGRREIGHGHLARRALVPLLPPDDASPYTIRIESLITESNGSSSMATVCGGSLAMFDAGVQLTRPVAGIAMGLVSEGDSFVVLSDILGDEDHVGDMDFKVCGTELGITAIQLDNKIGALPDEVMKAALNQAREGRIAILEVMAGIINAPREDVSKHAPRVATVKIEPNRIGSLVGSGGKTIKALQAEFGVNVDIAQNGQVKIFGSSSEAMKKAKERVIDLAGVAKVGETYEGTVVVVKPFGAFVRLFEGVDGLVSDPSLKQNDKVRVTVTGVNPKGKLVLEKA